MSLFRKFSSLAVLHGATLVLPLLIYPYLSHRLGPSAFGEFAVSQAVIQYLVLIVDYGFNLSATREVALRSHDQLELAKTFWSVFHAKAVLAVVCISVMTALLLVFSHNGVCRLIAIQFPLVIGAWLFPLWLMQALEKLTQAATLIIIARASTLPLAVMLVHDENDLNLAALSFGASGAILGILGLLLMQRLGLGRMPALSVRDISYRLGQGWSLFLSVAGSSFYTAINLVLLRLVAPGAEVGYFAAADKLRGAAVGLIPIMTNVLLPGSARQASISDTSLRKHFTKNRALLMVGALAFTGIFFGSPLFVPILFGNDMRDSIPVLQIMAFSALVIPISHVIGIQYFVAHGYGKHFSYSLIGAGLVNLLLMPTLGHYAGAIGAAFSLLIIESLIALTLIVAFKRHTLAHSEPTVVPE